MKIKQFFFLVAIVGWATTAFSGTVTPPSAGGSFSGSSPGAIGGTTSSTGQFTNIAAGASVPALDGTTGDISATGAFVCSTNNTSCVTQLNNAAAQVPLMKLDSGNTLNITSPASMVIQPAAANNLQIQISSGATRVQVNNTSLQVQNGATIQSGGGSIPTVTCSGGSTGTSVTAGSTNNRGSIVSSSSASTNCTITWSANGVWANAPFCNFFDAGASITPTSYSMGACGTSTCVVDFASATSKTIGYMCL